MTVLPLVYGIKHLAEGGVVLPGLVALVLGAVAGRVFLRRHRAAGPAAGLTGGGVPRCDRGTPDRQRVGPSRVQGLLGLVASGVSPRVQYLAFQ